MDQNLLKGNLDDVVERCVNGVGIEINTASNQYADLCLRTWAKPCGNIVAYRDKNGPFRSREALKKGATPRRKAFRQAARDFSEFGRVKTPWTTRQVPGKLWVWIGYGGECRLHGA
ncbi:MAG: helix-hairpin-helix domain-containing protein [Bacteroidia bacterium]